LSRAGGGLAGVRRGSGEGQEGVRRGSGEGWRALIVVEKAKIAYKKAHYPTLFQVI
jgi:hypothetical protein